MKATHFSIASLMLAFACTAALPAYADHHGPKGNCVQGQMPEMMQKRMTQRMEQRQATLKADLKLTPEQEPAWQTFVQAMKPPAQTDRPNPAELDAMTTPQRLEKMKAMRAEREVRVNQRMQAVQTFYSALTPEQQKVFDAHKPMTPHQRHQGHGIHS